jgi:hypothetical protein
MSAGQNLQIITYKSRVSTVIDWNIIRFLTFPLYGLPSLCLPKLVYICLAIYVPTEI